MIPGSTGKMLWVDLSHRTVKSEEIPDDLYRLYLGGYGLAEALVQDRQPAKADPLGEDNLLCLSAGLLTGTGVPFSGRFMVSAKSPATGGVGEANAGGHFGPGLKKSGFDLVAFHGKSEKPVYLWIQDGQAELRDASHLWGLDTVQTEEAIKGGKDGKSVAVACIGPAGEALSFMAGVVNDGARIAARMGLGAVMGSKNLKALAVSGKGTVQVHDKEKLAQVSKTFIARFKRAAFLDKWLMGRIAGPLGVMAGHMMARLGLASRQDYVLMRTLLRVYGTAGFASFSMQSGDGPIKNWNGNAWSHFPLKKSAKIADTAVLALQKRKYHCAFCPLGCGGEMAPPDCFNALPGCHKPEYESLGSLGSNLVVDDLDALLCLNDYANRAGIDTISLGGVLAFAAECVERGVLTGSDLDGLDVGWGKGWGFLELAKKIVKREGIGDVLADGVKVASQKIGQGSSEWAVHAGGIELPMHDPRNDMGYAAVYACDAAPGKHSSSQTFSELLQVEKVWPGVKGLGFTYSKKARFEPSIVGRRTAYGNLLFHLTSCAGLCTFGSLTSGASWPLFDWINACTGWTQSPEDYKTMGKRIVTLRWSLNRREGIGIKDFGISPRAIGRPPLTEGPNRGLGFDLAPYAKSYFEAMGWDYDRGEPVETFDRSPG